MDVAGADSFSVGVEVVLVPTGLIATLVLEPCDRVVDGALKKTADARKIALTITTMTIRVFDIPRLLVIICEASRLMERLRPEKVLLIERKATSRPR